MFFAKIFHFLKGYVILSITGNNKEKFVAEAAKKGYGIFDIKNCGEEITAKMLLCDYKRILELDGIFLVKIKAKRGIPFLLKRLNRKKGALAVLCVFLLIMSVGAQFIWTIEYDAEKGVNTEEIESALQLAGLKTGAFKGTLKKPEEIKNIILNNTDGICWCWVYIKGTKAIVRVRSSVIPKNFFAQNTPCDIIAARNGIIKRVITQKGRAQVTENQAVAAGDTIISGTFDFNDAAGYQVHSRGVVEAYTTHTRTGVYNQVYCYKTYTGRTQHFISLRLYGWEIPLYIKDRIRFENYDATKRNFDIKIGKDNYIGIGISVNRIKEFETQKEPISYETAVSFAKSELERDISRELLPSSQLISKNCDAKRIDENRVKVTVTMNFIEEIGTEKQIEEVKVIEPKNNQSARGD